MANIEVATGVAHDRKRTRHPDKLRATKHAARKLKQKRKRRERVAVPADQRWLNWEQAESVAGVSRNTLRPYLNKIGKRFRGRVIIDRHKLDELLDGQPSAA